MKSGLYNNASEVIREAPRFMETHADWVHELKVAHLRGQLQAGNEQLSPACVAYPPLATM